MKKIFLLVVVAFGVFINTSATFADTDTTEIKPLHQYPNVSVCTDLKSGYTISVKSSATLLDHRNLVPSESDPTRLYMTWVTSDPNRDNVKMNCPSLNKVTIEVTGTPVIIIHNNPFSVNQTQAEI